MKTILLTLFAASLAFAQIPPCTAPTPIQITGPINQLSGLMTGTILLQQTYSIEGNPPIVQSQFQVEVSAGVVYVNGVAQLCLPANAFLVANYAVQNPPPLAGSTRFTRYWNTPGSGGPYALNSSIESMTPQRQILVPAPPLSGSYCLPATNGVLTSQAWTTSCGGGNLSWHLLTSSSWAALTSSDWSGLTI